MFNAKAELGSRGTRCLGCRGFTLAEPVAVMAVIAIITLIGFPNFISYWQAAQLKAGAQELASIVNNGRQLAIRTNNFVCIERAADRVRFRLPALADSCAGTPWRGAGTDADGWFTLATQVRVVAATGNVVFTYLGAASPATTYTVRNPAGTATLSVNVAASGRVSIGP